MRALIQRIATVGTGAVQRAHIPEPDAMDRQVDHGRTRPSLAAGPVALVLLALGACAVPAARAGDTEHLMRLLDRRSCPGCRLQDADLVHAELRDADLQGAQLQRANLSQARLDGARLQGADLSFTSLNGASLRGADLRGARLEGTDLRHSDLSGAKIDPGGLSHSHWEQARGVGPEQLSYAELHNAGVEAAMAGRFPEAETFFGEAIRLQPDAAVSWVARGLTRSELGRNPDAVRDLEYASSLYARGGDTAEAKRLMEAAAKLKQPGEKGRGGNGVGGQMLSGAAGMVQYLAPLALKFLVPLGL